VRALSSAAGGFPTGFVWGAATSAYQIEGAAEEDGRGPSIWDVFARRPGAIRDGSSGAVADDHYHRFNQDIELMGEIGLSAYSFSVAWPRVLPEGRGRVNGKGLDFYSRLIDALLAHNIEPFVTLYHWDLPQALEQEGGWGSRDTVAAFESYAGTVVDALGDRVAHWTTLNEPWCSAFLGYAAGIHAPGVKDPAVAFRAAHHLLLAHGAAARRINGPEREVSIVLNLFPVHPATHDAADEAAASGVDAIQNRMFLDPIFGAGYPSDALELIERSAGLGHVRDGDLSQISADIDALGINYYRTLVVRASPDASEPAEFPGVGNVTLVKPRDVTSMGWGVEPDGLREILLRVTDEYPAMPLYVTENGAAFPDRCSNGRVSDTDRISFLDAHIGACRSAIASGVDLRGYFVWSFLDNFEWGEGYSQRFGIVWVDYETQERVLKDSALWYRDLILEVGTGASL
jgi:beta-glucosidase